ncbi:hypothetical protein Tco_1193026 [Tanacetum coccineum]
MDPGGGGGISADEETDHVTSVVDTTFPGRDIVRIPSGIQEASPQYSLTTEWKAMSLQYVDSKLVASQINGMYEASNGSMIKYLAKARNLATVPFHHLTKEILVEVLNERSTEVQEVQTILEEEGDNWMTPIIKYLEEGIVPSDNNEARALRAKIGQYTMESGVLFKKGYLIPMLRCVGPLQQIYVIRKITWHLAECM